MTVQDTLAVTDITGVRYERGRALDELHRKKEQDSRANRRGKSSRGRSRTGRKNSRRGKMMNGVLIIDKSAVPTSHDVVASVRRVLRMKKWVTRVLWTLRPPACFPLFWGKQRNYLVIWLAVTKATVGSLGVTTDTLDAVGEVLEEKPVDVTEEQIEAVLEQFRGDIKTGKHLCTRRKNRWQKAL